MSKKAKKMEIENATSWNINTDNYSIRQGKDKNILLIDGLEYPVSKQFDTTRQYKNFYLTKKMNGQVVCWFMQ